MIGFTLRTKIILAVCAIVAVALAANAYFHITTVRTELFESQRVRGKALAQAIVADVRKLHSTMAIADMAGLLGVHCYQLHELNKDDGLAHIAVLDRAGMIIAHSDPTRFGQPLADTELLPLLATNRIITLRDDRHYHTLIPLSSLIDGAEAVVDVGWRSEPVDRSVVSILSFSLIMFLASTVVASAAVSVLLSKVFGQLEDARRAAEQGAKAKTDFLANMSHEIRTPMNAILGMARLALRSGLDPRQHDYVIKIFRSAQALLGIINDILDFSKIEAGKLTLEEVPFAIDEVLETVANLVGMRAEEKGLEVIFRTDAKVPRMLLGDPLRFGQVLVNLANNAVKFTDCGEIELSAQVIDETAERIHLAVSVRDTGIGMSEEQCLRLFQPFAQADPSTTRRFGGTGLGLAICHHLVAMMGGELRVVSAPDRGSIFTFTLWVGRGPQQERPAALTIPRLAGRRAMVVDDNDTNRAVLKELLAAWELEVCEADSGEGAVRAVRDALHRREGYDVILVDWKMPGMDGLTASQRILQEYAPDQPPLLLMVTAYDRAEVVDRARQVGIREVLTKPLTSSVLFDAIVRCYSESGELEQIITQLPGHGDDWSALAGVRILVVEDNEINQQVAVELLTDVGATVDIAADGRQGVEMVRDGAYDLVLMDMQMPVMDGYTATRTIRGELGRTDLPIIAMTAHAMAGEREKCLAAGMNDYLAKPIDPDHMYLLLAQWLKRSPGATAQPAVAASGAGASNTDSDSDTVLLPDHLPGFDLVAALARVRGKRDLLRRLILGFRDRNARFGEEMRSALAAGDLERASLLAHSLKGAAGTLGASAVQAAAGQVETALREQRVEAVPALLAAAEQALERALAATVVLDRIETAEATAATDAADAADTAAPPAFDRETVTAAAAALDALLAKNSLRARKAFAEFKGLAAGHGGAESWEGLEHGVERLDFAAARVALAALTQDMHLERETG